MTAAYVNQRVSPTRRHCFLSPGSGERLLTLFPVTRRVSGVLNINGEGFVYNAQL
jgi:hypothetical protein